MIKVVKLIFLFCLISPPAFATSPISIVVLGDSLAAGYRLPKADGFVSQLQSRLDSLGYDVLIIDAAVPGDTTKGGLSRLDWALPTDTDGVIIELGANDALRGLPVEKSQENLNVMIERIKSRGIEILLAGMLSPPNLGEDYANEFNSIYPQLAQTHNILLYPFFLDGVASNLDLNLEDAIHPNKRGVEVIVDNMIPSVEAMIAKIAMIKK